MEVDFSGWGQDRFSKGSYSFAGLGSVVGDRDQMAQPEGRFYFAGEHTTRSWATVHGAFGNGVAAANEVRFTMKADGGNATNAMQQPWGYRRPAARWRSGEIKQPDQPLACGQH